MSRWTELRLKCSAGAVGSSSNNLVIDDNLRGRDLKGCRVMGRVT